MQVGHKLVWKSVIVMVFCAIFVLGNLSDRKSYDEKLQDTLSI